MVEENGSIIKVPPEFIEQIRFKIASSGFPKSDVVGFEIFNEQSFGTTSFVQKINKLRALQGELVRTINNLDAVRIKEAANADLEAKGLMITSNNPDFLIAADILTKEKLRITRWGYPYYYSYRVYHGPPKVDTYQYQEGTFILDFVEPTSKKLIWHGAARVALDYANTPEKRDKLIKEAIQRILQNFPPPSE